MKRKNKGRGRPKGEKTVVKRIPKVLGGLVDGIIKNYKDSKARKKIESVLG